MKEEMTESSYPPKTFSGVRFALVGFSPNDSNTLRSKLLSGGGVDVGQYNQNCTHLIVNNLVYDDPICVEARTSGKVVVTRSWVDHSFDIGMIIDANSVLYKPLRDLNGIPGCKSLVVCLTGYQRQDREDIMTMVDLMGEQFSKPLVANKITHLICYKFEGEKYELAKRIKRIKIVNHRWLEDCLKNWKLLPEVNYEISGYDLEIMEASAQDSEDEAEDAAVKRENNSPLGLRVGAPAAVEMPKSEGKDIPVVQTNSGARDGPLNDDWLTPKRTDRPVEAMISTDAVAPQQFNNQRASTCQESSNNASVNKTPEQEMRTMETDKSTSAIMSVRTHSSLATYSRKTVKKSPETSTLVNKSGGQNSTMGMVDRGLTPSTTFNISASKPGSSLERTTLFDDLDKETPSILPQTKFKYGSLSSKGSEKVQSISPLASLSLQGSRYCSPNTNDPTESGHKSPAKVVPVEDIISAAKNTIPTCARGEISERSSAGTVLLQEPRSGTTPKQREVAYNMDLSDSATMLFNSSNMPMETVALEGAFDEVAERFVTEPDLRSSTSPGLGSIGTKDQLETEVPKKKTAPRKNLGTRGRKRTPVNQKGSIFLSKPIPHDEGNDCLNKGEVSAVVSDNGNQKEISSPVLNTDAVPKPAKPIDSDTENLNDEFDAAEENDLLPLDMTENQNELQAKSPQESDAEVGITMVEEEGYDVPSDGALPLEVDKSKSKRKREPTVAKNTHQSGKKGSSSTAKAGKSSVKKTKKSRKEDDAKANDTVMNDLGDNSEEEKNNLALENNSGKVISCKNHDRVVGGTSARKEAVTEDPYDAAVEFKEESTVEKNGKKGSSSGKLSVKKAKKSKKEDEANEEANENVTTDKNYGDVSSDRPQSPVARKPLRKKATAKDPINDVAPLEVDKNKRKRGKETAVEKSSLQNKKKDTSSTTDVKKTKKTKKERIAKETDALKEDIEDNSAEEKENTAVDNKTGNVDSDGDQSPISRKPIARKKSAKSTKTSTVVGKESKQLSGKALQDQEQEPKFFTFSGPRAQRSEYQKIIKSLNGKCCRDSHQWSYQATHFIAPEIRRTEKFFAATASGSWILKTDYVADSKEAGKLLPEEPYEWHNTGLSADGTINLESPRKWRLVREQTGHGALYGMRIVIYGDCAIPSLDTLKRAVKSGDGTILATAPPYTRFLNENTDFALISPGIPRDDVWIQELLRHEIPCVLADYVVEYVCKTGYALDKHVLYNTNSWAERSFKKLQRSVDCKIS